VEPIARDHNDLKLAAAVKDEKLADVKERFAVLKSCPWFTF
jgi:hypothetical protein